MVKDSDIARGFEALFNTLESSHQRDKQKQKIAEAKANQPVLSHHQHMRQQFLDEITDAMEQFGMESTGSPALDKILRERVN